MKDSLAMLCDLRRPNLLVRAARHGVSSYQRERDLRRLVGGQRLPGPREAILRLLEEEATLETARKSGQGRYNMHRHVEIMIALTGEAMLARRTQRTELRVV